MKRVLTVRGVLMGIVVLPTVLLPVFLAVALITGLIYALTGPH
jgi:hypothetical protein